MNRLLVCGSHLSPDPSETWDRLDKLVLERRLPDLVISGGAAGVDTWAREWAERRGLPCMVIYAPWHRFGKSAGPLRNGWMLKYGQPDLVLAMPGGPGTADMVRKAKMAGIEVVGAGK